MAEYICPNCKNPIYDDEALLCHFCGEGLKRSSKGALGKMKYGPGLMVWYIVIGIILASFILLFVR